MNLLTKPVFDVNSSDILKKKPLGFSLFKIIHKNVYYLQDNET